MSERLETPVQPLLEEALSHNAAQLELCMRLEMLADHLPENFNRQECLSISWQLYPTLRSAHKFEEGKLFPFLLLPCQTDSSIVQSIERLRHEHWEDESSAEDLGLNLREMVKNPVAANIDKISYMLRGFFEGLRRHIAFETEHLLPMLEGKQ